MAEELDDTGESMWQTDEEVDMPGAEPPDRPLPDGNDDTGEEPIETAEGAEDTGETNDDDPTREDDENEEPDPNDPIVTLDDGEEVSLSELGKGYMRQRDYSQKTEEVARQREHFEQSVEAYTKDAMEFAQLKENLFEFLKNSVPDEPDPNLINSNPAAYHRLKMVRDNVLNEVAQVVNIVDQADGQLEATMKAQKEKIDTREEESLLRVFPALRDPAKRQKFDAQHKEAAKSFGFTDEEVAAFNDHRVKRLVHFARIGMQAQNNRSAGKRRVVSKMKGKTRAATDPQRNRSAMARLAKTGRLEDAMGVDFAD